MRQITIPHRVYLSIIQAATLTGAPTHKLKKKDEFEILIDARYGIVVGRDKNGNFFIRNEKESDNGKNPK